MTILCIIALLLLYGSVVECGIWRESNIQEARELKHCIYIKHALQIHYLFPGISMKRDEREARALDFLSRQLKIGGDFCVSFAIMVNTALQHLEGEVARSATAGDPQEIQHAWQDTLSQFLSRKQYVLSRCVLIEEGMQAEEKKKYTGILAPMQKCINRVNLATVKALIVDQYREEEQGF